MSKIIKRTLILGSIFLAALGIYFIAEQSTIDKSEAVYTVMEEPSLPIVYTQMAGGEQNRLAAYRQEMSQAVSRESVTTLPQNRELEVRIAECKADITAAQYEIRSMDLSRLVERTSIEDWQNTETDIKMVLPIQNLLVRDTEYLLHLMLEVPGQGVLHYYTRILWAENDYASQMMDLAREFSTKSLTPGQAGDLVTYLETSDTADNSSLGHVTIKSSFSQLTWAGLDMRLEGDMQVTLKDLDGIMGQIQVQYQVSRQSEGGEIEYYDVIDNYTMRWNSKRIYMMDFDRITNQIFSGERELFSGRRLMLGIGNDEAINLKKSSNGTYLAFVFNRDLWCYNQTEAKAIKIFSFRSSSDESKRSSYNRHDIKIVSVSDEGDIEFMVYGYMNRGQHEGQHGISLCQFDHSGAIREQFFIPATESFDEIRLGVEKLSYYNGIGMMYLFWNESIIGIDLSSNEYIVVAENLTEGSYAISQDGAKLAWQEGIDAYGGSAIHLFNLATGATHEIRAPEGDYVQCLGFVQEDFVYGLSHKGETWNLNGRTECLPMYALEIVDDNLQLQTRYEKEGYYIANVQVEDARIHIERYQKYGEHEYTYLDEDTIVCNTVEEDTYMEGIGWFASEIRRKLYFVQLSSEVRTSKSVKVTAAKRITYDESDTLELQSDSKNSQVKFYSYGQGTLIGIYEEFAEAVNASYEDMGVVTDENQRILWNRVNRDSNVTIRDAHLAAYDITRSLDSFSQNIELEDGVMLIDARGCTLNQVLYFIGQGYPVLAYLESGSYVLLNGFDQYNVSIFQPETGESIKMGLNDGAQYFQSQKNDFICAVAVGS